MSDSIPPVPPQDPAYPPVPPIGSPEGGRTGPSWERPGPFFERFATTAYEVLLSPTAFFSTMRREGGLAGPLTFGIVGALVGGVATAIYQLLLSMAGAGFGGPDAVRDQVFASLFSTGCILVILPFAGIVGMFISALIYHLMLLLLGGARHGFETTMRVTAYTSGAVGLLQLLPICGSAIAGVWSLVVAIIGLSRAHEISTAKAAAAVLLPIAICCVMAMLFSAAILTAIFGGAAASSFHR
jgi:hypothetical protein